MSGESMRAIVYHGPQDKRLEQRAIPEIASDEALLRVGSTSICGTDLRIYHGDHRKYPPGTVRIPGHEVAGEIVAVGSQVTGMDPDHRAAMMRGVDAGCQCTCMPGTVKVSLDILLYGRRTKPPPHSAPHPTVGLTR